MQRAKTAWTRLPQLGGGRSSTSGTTNNVFGGRLKWLFAIFFLIGSGAHVEGAPTWIRAVGSGGGGSDQGLAAKADNLGNQYVTGEFSSNASFGARTLSSDGERDIFLAKYAPSGDLLWLLQAGGAGDDVGNDLGLDEAGNVYVTGFFTSSASFRSTSGAARTVNGNGETIFLAKYSPKGVLVWLQTGAVSFGLENNDGIGVVVDPVTGTVFITGRSLGETTFSSSDGSKHTVPGPGTWHMFLVKYDSSGHFQWGEWNQASPNSIGNKVAVDADGSAYVTGWLEGTTTFHSKDGHNITITGLSGPVQNGPDYPNDAFIVKYDSSGNTKWVNQIGGYKGDAIDIAASPDGKISITGLIGNINYGSPSQAATIVTSQPGASNINLGGGHFTNPFNRDVFIATYNTAGALLKASRYGGAQNDGGSGIAYDRDGNLYVEGVFQGTISIDGQSLTGGKAFNLFVVKYATGGGLNWAKKADGAGTDKDGFQVNPRICLTPTGTVLVAGQYRDTAVFDATTLHSAGAEDIFLAELCQEGCVTGCAEDVTSQLHITRTPIVFNPTTQLFEQTVRMKNISNAVIPARVSLVLDGLSAGARLVNFSGYTRCAAPLLSPYRGVGIGADNLLQPGELAQETLRFTYSGTRPITYHPRVLAGTNPR